MKLASIVIGGYLLGAGLGAPVSAEVEATPPTGTWRINNWMPGDSLHLKLSYRKASTHWEWGSDQPIADLRGLTYEQLHSAHAPVAFTLQRDAGTFNFEGSVTLGIGRGTYQFLPDSTYAGKLGALGYGEIDNDVHVIMFLAVRDVSMAYASDVKFSGLKDVTISDLVRLQDHGVSLEFIRASATIGLTDLTAADVVRFTDHGIDVEFLRALKASNVPELSAADVVRLHDHGVRPEYVARIHAAGYPDLTVDQLIKLHEHDVN